MDVLSTNELKEMAKNLAAQLGKSIAFTTALKAYTPAPYSVEDDEIIQCPNCQRQNDTDAQYCDQCGYHLATDGYQPQPYSQEADEIVRCPSCGRGNDTDATYCDQCGYNLTLSDDDDDGDTPVQSTSTQPLVAQFDAVLATNADLVDRMASLAALRRKDGRVLSTANRRKLAGHLGTLREMADELEQLLAETDPGKALIDDATRFALERLRAEQLGIVAAVNG